MPAQVDVVRGKFARMIYKLLLSIFIVSWVGVVQINGQLCTPLTVENLTISQNAVLTWQPNSAEACEINSYVVNIDSGPNTDYIYVLSSPSLSITFLPVCGTYLFRIAAVSSDNLEGPEFRLDTKIPLPVGANLTVAFLKVTPQDDVQQVLLEWNLEDQWENCADRFRVIIDDQDLDYLQDTYTYNNSLQVPSLSPCTSYEFGVIAIYNWEIEGPVAVVQYNSPPLEINAPYLTNIALGNTYVNMTWQLEPYPFNKCAVTEAYVEISDIVASYNLTVPVLDQTIRQPLTVSLPNLRADNLYFVTTTVVNIAGPSESVLVAVQTRP